MRLSAEMMSWVRPSYEALEYCLRLIGPVQHLPTFPNRVEQRKPNFPTKLAASAAVSFPDDLT